MFWAIDVFLFVTLITFQEGMLCIWDFSTSFVITPQPFWGGEDGTLVSSAMGIGRQASLRGYAQSTVLLYIDLRSC